jgi:hypothetical protein
MNFFDKINYGNIPLEVKKASIIFLSIFYFCNLTGISSDTIFYINENKIILSILNFINLSIFPISLYFLVKQKITIQQFNLPFIYFLAFNIIFTDFFFYLSENINWESTVVRNAYIYTICIITIGVINNFKHVLSLSILYICSATTLTILSQSTNLASNLAILILVAVGFSIGVYAYVKILKKTYQQKIELQKKLFEKEKELEQEKNSRLQEQIEFKNRELTL